MKKLLLSLIIFAMITQSATSQNMNINILKQIDFIQVIRDNNINAEYPIAFSLNTKCYAIAYDKKQDRRHHWGKVLFHNPNVTKPTQIFEFKKPERESGQISDLAYSSDGKIIAIGRLFDITLIDASSGKVLQTFPTEPIREESNETKPIPTDVNGLPIVDVTLSAMQPAGGLNFSPDGKKLLAYAGSTVNIWNVEDGKLLKRFEGEECIDVDSFNPTFSPDGKTFAVRCDQKNGSNIKIIDTQNYHTVKILKEHDNSIISLVFSPSGNLLASSSAKKCVIKVWNVDSGNIIKEFEGNRDEIVVYIDKNTMVTLDDDSEYMYILKTWSLKDGKVVRVQKLSEYLKERVPSIEDALKQLPVIPSGL